MRTAVQRTRHPAHRDYLAKRAILNTKLARLEEHLLQHQVQESYDATNWRFSGDLDHWIGLLDQILSGGQG